MPSTGPRILIVLGTRPEVIKLAPVERALRTYTDWQVSLCCTGQHRELVPPILNTFGLQCEVELSAMTPAQSLSSLMARLLDGIDPVLDALRFDWVVVQGDTTTALAGALAAFHRRIPVAHVEAGLRTLDLAAPFPEEANRQLIARLASLHLAPTPAAREALLAEGVSPEAIEVTGNTVVDALRWASSRLPLEGAPAPELVRFAKGRPFVLVTGHRRESFAGGLAAVCTGLATLARAYPQVDFVYPVHLNPAVQSAARGLLGGLPNVFLLEPLEYMSAVWLLKRCMFVITDSGGLQEEAPEFGKPVLVTRTATERMEGVAAGCAVLVGYDTDLLVTTARRWLDDPAAYAAVCPRKNPYGDGRAASRCAAALRRRLGLPAAAVTPWPEARIERATTDMR
jgi:UDP-N-acetylglucosamine 2-epimerase (non-hydrolysing)